MRHLLFLILLPALGMAQETSLDDARVQLTYRELRALIDAAHRQPPVSAIENAILSAHYEVRFNHGAATGTAAYDIQTFRDGQHLIPLAGEDLIVDGIEPADATLVVFGNHYTLVLEGRQRVRVSLKYSTKLVPTEGGSQADIPVGPAITTTLAVPEVPPGRQIVVEDGLPVPSAPNTWRLGRTSPLRIRLSEPPQPLPPPVTMPALIREASSELRIVTDGAFSNKMTWQIQHQAPLVWTISLPDSNQIVSCQVNGRPALPSRVDAKTLEIRLGEPPTGGESSVSLSYTGRGRPFDPVRGEISANLPSTPLLIEKLAWRITMQPVYEVVAAEGNADFLPGNTPGEIRLSKELCQGDSPAMRIFYQKPETKKNP